MCNSMKGDPYTYIHIYINTYIHMIVKSFISSGFVCRLYAHIAYLLTDNALNSRNKERGDTLSKACIQILQRYVQTDRHTVKHTSNKEANSCMQIVCTSQPPPPPPCDLVFALFCLKKRVHFFPAKWHLPDQERQR